MTEKLNRGFTKDHHNLSKQEETITNQEKETVQEYLYREVVQDKVRRKCRDLKNTGFIKEEPMATGASYRFKPDKKWLEALQSKLSWKKAIYLSNT